MGPATDDEALLAHFQRFLDKRPYAITETGCHVWQGTRNATDYGLLNHLGKVYLAHRLSWQLIHGPISNGLFVMHKCDNPPCINPDHLTLGTAADNARDMVEKGRSIRGKQMPHRKYKSEPDATEQYALDGRVYTGDSAKKMQANARAREYQKRRYAEDPNFREKKKASTRRWQKEHPEQARASEYAARARKREVVDLDWRMRRYERIQQQRQQQTDQEQRERLRTENYSVAEIAQIAQVERSTVMRWIYSGRLKAIQTTEKYGLRVTPDVLFPFLTEWSKGKYTRYKGRNIP